MHGHDILKKIENVGDEDGRPSVTVKIVNSGVLGGKTHMIQLKRILELLTSVDFLLLVFCICEVELVSFD